MYRNPNVDEWLASPVSSYDDYFVCIVNDGGALGGSNWGGSGGVAPLVSLKSGVDMTNSD